MIVYLDDYIDERKNVIYNKNQISCSDYIWDIKPVSIIASNLEVAKSPARIEFIITANIDIIDKIFDSDLNSNFIQLLIFDQKVNSLQLIKDKLNIYNVVSQLSYIAIMKLQETYTLYKTRAIYWRRSYISCSFVYTVQVDSAYFNYIQKSYTVFFKNLKLNFRFIEFSIYYSCDQPLFFYSNQDNNICE